VEQFPVNHGEAGARVTLTPVVDLTAAESLKDALLDACGGTGSVVIDGAAVERIDTPALQILLAAAAVLHSENRVFSLVGPSQALMDAMADLGFAAELDRWRDG
jgi:anti-anti-sigma regulatory factor